MVAFSLTAKEGDPKDRLNWAFNYYDLNNNDYIELKELEKVIKVSSLGQDK